VDAPPADARHGIDDRDVWQQVRAQESVQTETDGCVLGPSTTSSFRDDPKHLLFTLARYKFAAKLIGDDHDRDVLEVGCSEGLATALLAQVARSVVAIDFDAAAIDWAQRHAIGDVRFRQADFRHQRFGRFDAVVSIDVIEHCAREHEAAFVRNLRHHLRPNGICIVGTPNQTASPYASELSALGHINLFDAPRLTALFRRHFHNVFLFGMNDEVVHTGFAPMCHYLFVLACQPKHRTAREPE